MTRELDIEQPKALLEYLRCTGRIAASETPKITVLTGGVSNRTVLVEKRNGLGMVLKQALPKLRVKADWFSDPARIQREALGLKWLSQLAPPGTITPLVFEDHAHHLLAMEAVPQPHENWKKLLLAGQVDRNHVQQFGRLLGTIHGQALAAKETLSSLFEERAYFESLRLEPYYRFAGQRNPAARDFLDRLINDTQLTQLTLVHGDYSPKNILVHQNRLVLLDHEVIHWGDPAFDLGFSLTHLLSKACHLPNFRAVFLEAARLYWASYRHAFPSYSRQAELESRAVRHTLGCLLARVDGRSPLEYLNKDEQDQQRILVTGFMQNPPATLPAFFDAYAAALCR